MSENLTPKTNPKPIQEGINPEQLTEERKETLKESISKRVAEALEKIRGRVKAYTEVGKIKEHSKKGEYAEILQMIEEYPEDIKTRILNRYLEEIKENSDQIPPNQYLRSNEIFGSKVKDEEGKDKIKDGERERVSRKLTEVIKSGDIKTLIRNLDLLEILNSALLKSIARDLILKSDESVIQEEIKNCPENIRKLYEYNFEKKYLKGEYIDKAIKGARGKLESAQTEEGEKKYKQVIEGLEYLRDWEKNTREHCRKMFEQYGIFNEEMVSHIIQKTNERMLRINYMITTLAKNNNLDYIECLGLVQTQLNEMVKEMTIVTQKNARVIKNIFSEDKSVNRIFSRFEGNLGIVSNTRPANNNGESIDIMEKQMFGENYNEEGSKHCFYGILSYEDHIINKNTKFSEATYEYGSYRIILNKKLKERATFVFGDSCTGRGSSEPEVTFVEYPHVAVIINEMASSSFSTETVDLGLDRQLHTNPLIRFDRYLETQIHGEAGFAEDIDYIIATVGGNDYKEITEKISSYNQNSGRNIVVISAYDYFERWVK